MLKKLPYVDLIWRFQKKIDKNSTFFDINFFRKIKTVSPKMDAQSLNLDFLKLQTICNKTRKVKQLASHFQFFFVGA